MPYKTISVDMVGTSNQSVPEMAIDHFLGDMIDMISDARMNRSHDGLIPLTVSLSFVVCYYTISQSA